MRKTAIKETAHYTQKHPLREIKVLPEYKELVHNVVQSRKTGRIRAPQGIIVNINHVTGEAVAIPAFNKNDGSTKLMRQVCTYTKGEVQVPCYLESLQPRGGFTGDLHTGAVNRAGWGEHGGVNGGVSGMAIFLDENGEVVEIKNRSASQNFFSNKWSEIYCFYFKWKFNYIAYPNSREIPLAPFQYYINQVLTQLGLQSAGNLLESKLVNKKDLEYFKFENEYSQDPLGKQRQMIEDLFPLMGYDDTLQKLQYLYSLNEPWLMDEAVEELYLRDPDRLDDRHFSLTKNGPELKSKRTLFKLVKSEKSEELLDFINSLKTEFKPNDFQKIINYRYRRLGRTALDIAISARNFKIVKILGEAGALVNITNTELTKLAEAGETEIVQFLELLSLGQKLEKDFNLFCKLSQFLDTKFLDSKRDVNEAKAFRHRILAIGLSLIEENAKKFPEYIVGIKKAVAACQIMHYAPETQFFTPTCPKYPVLKNEGALIPNSSPQQYGTHQSTALFYQICDAYDEKNGKVNQSKIEIVRKELSKNLNINKDFIYFFDTYSDTFNLDSKHPGPLEKTAQEVLLKMCSYPKVTTEIQSDLIKQAIAQCSRVIDIEMDLYEKIRELFGIRHLIVNTPIFKVQYQCNLFACKLYFSKNSDDERISVSAPVKRFERTCLEYVAKIYQELSPEKKEQFISEYGGVYSCTLSEARVFTASPELIEMCKDIEISMAPSRYSINDIGEF